LLANVNDPTTMLSLVAGGIGLSFAIKSAERTKPDSVVLREVLSFVFLAIFGTFSITETGGRLGCNHRMSLECLAIRWHNS